MWTHDRERPRLTRVLAGLFRELAYPSLCASAEYAAGLPPLEQLLRTLNRVLHACHEHRDYGAVTRDAYALAADHARELPADREPSGERLICYVELYLKAVLWLVKPTLAAQLRGNRSQYTLAPVLRALDLLGQQELDLSLEQAGSVADPVRRQLLIAYRGRNEISHSPRDLAPHLKAQLPHAALTTLLAPLVKHAQALRAALAGVLIWPLVDPELHAILRITDSERRNHLQHFVARQQDLERLRDLVTDKLASGLGGYLLVTGTEGVGKSALCARLLTECPSPQPLGPQAEQVRRLAPWLPTALLVSGKQARQPQEVGGLLLAQAQALLDEPLPSLTQAAGLGPLPREARAPGPGQRLPGMYGPEEAEQRHPHADPEPHGAIHINRLLYHALERLAEERGPTLVVIDAIDEISADGALLDFLPESLPAGITAVLTTRQGVSAIEWAQQNLQADTWRLAGFERSEVPMLTGVPDATPAQREFNDAVLKQTEGVPLLISAAMRSVREHGGSLSALSASNMDSVMLRRVADWQPPAGGSESPRYELLLLLSLFEPVCSLPLAAAQGFLLQRQIDLTLYAIRTLLEPVRDQIVGLEDNEVRLNLRLLAEYVRDRHCSPRDRRRLLTWVTAWLGSDEELSATLLARFLHHWTQEQHNPDEPSRQIVGALPDRLTERRAGQMLRRVGLMLRSYTEPLGGLVERCLRAAVQLGDVPAMGALGDDLLHGKLGHALAEPQRLAEGVLWLKRAAEGGDTMSMTRMGYHLLEGAGMPADSQEGGRWLRKAAEAGDVSAMGLLGYRLLTGDKLPADPAEGERWLRKAAETGDVWAMGLLGRQLLDGENLRMDPVEGERLLRKAAETGDAWAMGTLGRRLLDGEKLAANLEEGERWLRKTAEASDAWAMGSLGTRLLEGDKIAANPEEGERWLRKAAEAGDAWAMGSLGTRLLEGDKLAANPEEGARWLRRSAEAGSSWSVGALGRRLLDGDKIAADPVEGERFLRRAAEAGEPVSMGRLGVRLLDGDKIAADRAEGERWLRKAAEAEDAWAMGTLGRRLLDGDKLAEDPAEGERWLRRSAQAGETDDMELLGVYLLWGRKFKRELGNVQQWLSRVSKLEDAQALADLKGWLLAGERRQEDIREAEQWLRKAAAADRPRAAMALACALTCEVITDEGDAVSLLRQAADARELQGENLKLVGQLLYQQGLVEEAAKVFHKGVLASDPDAATSLAYIIRRGEIGSIQGVELPALLTAARQSGDPVAHINWALCLAAGVQVERDWQAADRVIAEITDTNLLGWWQDLAAQDDGEGHLVLGWLARHARISDPEGLPFGERLARARDRGWAVPDWLLQPPPPRE